MALCVLLFLAVWWFSNKSSTPGQNPGAARSTTESKTAGLMAPKEPLLNRPASSSNEGATNGSTTNVAGRTLPLGKYEYVFNQVPGKNRFLLSKAKDAKFVADSDAPTGRDLWMQDEDGKERLVADSVYRARFSPDGTKIAYATSEGLMRVEDLQGQKLAEAGRAYEPSWRPDGGAVVFAQVPEGRPIYPPEVLRITTLDLTTGETRSLTDGRWDDGRPEYTPTGDCVIFVSGGRSGLASFWRVCPGQEPQQLTNSGATTVDEKFVPTPYDRTLWTKDKRWFVYDFKSGPREEIWSLEFSDDGRLKQTQKLANGLNPQLREDGQTIVYSQHNGGTTETIAYQFH